MKRILLAIAAAALPFSAAASPELAGDWGLKAGDLREQTASLIEKLDTSGKADITPAFETEIERFAYAATQLGRWIDGNDGPSDLGCIFRGMAEEGIVQLDALEDSKKPLSTHYGALLGLSVLGPRVMYAFCAAEHVR